VLLALSTGHKVGIIAVAAVFIAFALVSAFVMPRWRPDFPGNRVGLYVLVVVILFAGMMSAVFVFGKEGEEHEAAAGEATSAEQTTEAPTGNAAAGKPVFLSAGCGACHAFKEAGASATVGPNLDQVLKGKDAAFIHESIVDPNKEIASGFQPNVMPENFEQQLSAKQLDDLVAFLSQAT
jgi:mono/diheme cytochrome c family protein